MVTANPCEFSNYPFQYFIDSSNQAVSEDKNIKIDEDKDIEIDIEQCAKEYDAPSLEHLVKDFFSKKNETVDKHPSPQAPKSPPSLYSKQLKKRPAPPSNYNLRNKRIKREISQSDSPVNSLYKENVQSKKNEQTPEKYQKYKSTTSSCKSQNPPSNTIDHLQSGKKRNQIHWTREMKEKLEEFFQIIPPNDIAAAMNQFFKTKIFTTRKCKNQHYDLNERVTLNRSFKKLINGVDSDDKIINK